jgi:hypothetical protein
MATINPLSESVIEAAQPRPREYQLVDANGLRLRVMPNGTKTWAVRVPAAAGIRQVTLGDYPPLSLSGARAAATAEREAAAAQAAATSKSDDTRALRELAHGVIGDGLKLVNALHAQLGRPVEVADVLRVLRSKPRD